MLGFQECSWNVLGLLFNSNYLPLKQCTVCIWVQAGEEGTGDMNLLYARWMSPLNTQLLLLRVLVPQVSFCGLEQEWK